MPVAPDVWRIPLPLPGDGLRAVNTYAVRAGDGVVMIDAGWAVAEAETLLEQGLGAAGFDLSSVQRFLVTHVHRDHYTQAVTVRRRFGTRVSLGRGERPTLEHMLAVDEVLPAGLVERLRRAGAGELLARLEAEPATEADDRAVWERPDDWLRHGEVVAVGTRRLTVLETPGHTRGHVVFHDPEARLLFAGDHVLPHITPSIGFESRPSTSPLARYLSSLRMVGALADSTLLPAHGAPLPSTRSRVADLLAHHDRRLDETEAAVRRGASTAAAVAELLPWTSRRRAFGELDDFNQLLAVNETLAHLDVLAEQGRIGAQHVDAVDHFAV